MGKSLGTKQTKRIALRLIKTNVIFQVELKTNGLLLTFLLRSLLRFSFFARPFKNNTRPKSFQGEKLNNKKKRIRGCNMRGR